MKDSECIKKNIVDFIKHFKGSEQVFMCGMCYWFSKILYSRFGCGKIIYDVIVGHFMWVYDGIAYDVEGAHEIPLSYTTMEELRILDPNRYLRIIKSCVFKTDDWSEDL